MESSEVRLKPVCTRADALGVLNRLRKAGHTAYFAGGCVRDQLLGLEPKDWDVATDAPPERITSLFPSTQTVGAAFGVVLVRTGKSQVEVATFRADGTYSDGRRPDSVRFTSAEEDARRRDFTINGLFFDPIANTVIDFVGGRDDLTARKIRAIGNARERFSEDHLRLLRAVRFAARFEFEIEPGTAAAIEELAPRIKGISPERVGDEIRRMLTPPSRQVAWKLLWNLGLGREIFRFLTGAAEKMRFERSVFLELAAGEGISTGLSLAAATLCARMQGEGSVEVIRLLMKPEVGRAVRAMRQALRISNEESEEMGETLRGIEPLLRDAPPSLAAKKRFLARATSGGSRKLMAALAKLNVHRERIEALGREFAELEKSDVAPAPLISGDDLVAAGFEPGPQFKEILDAVYDAQLEGRLESKEQAMRFVTESRSGRK